MVISRISSGAIKLHAWGDIVGLERAEFEDERGNAGGRFQPRSRVISKVFSAISKVFDLKSKAEVAAVLRMQRS